MPTAYRFAIGFVLVMLVAPPGWCCAIIDCPFVCCGSCGSEATCACRETCESCEAGESSETDVSADRGELRPSDVPRAPDGDGPVKHPGDCPCRTVLSQLEKGPVRGTDLIAPACGLLQVVWVSETLGGPPTLAARILPTYDFQSRLCRWRC